MSGERDSKRVRQACVNCRRKKTRCSGERPVCSFCARLGQICRYDGASSGSLAMAGTLQQANSNLAARVALLESRLTMLDASAGQGADSSMFPSSSASGQLFRTTSNTTDDMNNVDSDDFNFLPEIQVLRGLIDTYFQHSHAQPYTYFHEPTFRERFDEGHIPTYLLFAVCAIAVRFSDDPFYAGRKATAIHAYSRTGWAQILEQSFSDGHDHNIQTVQATNILGIVDYVSGRNKLAWVKIGLSIRFAQTLQLGREPDEATTTMAEQIEHRNTFWSVYLLDRLITCGRNRPPTILDTDCLIRLPTRTLLQPASRILEPTIASMNEIPDKVWLDQLDQSFGLVIFGASTLGAITRWAFQHTTTDPKLPWDSRSEFQRISSVLVSFESHSEVGEMSLPDILRRDFMATGVLDVKRASHIIYAHVLYHLNVVMLNHPFFLQQALRHYNAKIPPTFHRDAIRKSREHAFQLSTILQSLQHVGMKTVPSFFGYAAILAGAVLRLHSCDPQGDHRLLAEQECNACLEFLSQEHAYYEFYKKMSQCLSEFKPDEALAGSLLNPSTYPVYLEPATCETLWRLCDYSLLASLVLPSARSPTSPGVDERSHLLSQSQENTHINGFEVLFGPAFLPADYRQMANAVSDGADQIAHHPPHMGVVDPLLLYDFEDPFQPPHRH